MPTYTYQCKKCESVKDVFHGMSEAPRIKCDGCGSTRMNRLIGSGAGVIFKGGGFYETDYKTKTGTKDSSDSGGKSEGKGDAKPDSKPEKSSTSDSTSTSDSKGGSSGDNKSKGPKAVA